MIDLCKINRVRKGESRGERERERERERREIDSCVAVATIKLH